VPDMLPSREDVRVGAGDERQQESPGMPDHLVGFVDANVTSPYRASAR
jgi:hypothetical protein